MNYRRLGRTGLKVSEISLGSWLTYGTSIDFSLASRTIETAYDLGINFFDTANIYNHGKAEEIVGKVLRNYDRSTYVVATKVFYPMGETPNERGLSRKHIMEQAEASLRRLGLDYIDLYYVHDYDQTTPIEETLSALNDLVRQGKVFYIGVSKWTATQILEALQTSESRLMEKIVVNQPRYHMFARDIENDIIPLCEKYGVGQVVFSPLAQGILTGKYKRGEKPPKNSRAVNPKSNKNIGNLMTADVLDKVEQLEKLAQQSGISLTHMALSWVLRQPNVSSAIIGASNPSQVQYNVHASNIQLSTDILEEIEKVLSGHGNTH